MLGIAIIVGVMYTIFILLVGYYSHKIHTKLIRGLCDKEEPPVYDEIKNLWK